MNIWLVFSIMHVLNHMNIYYLNVSSIKIYAQLLVSRIPPNLLKDLMSTTN